ncbi:vasotocin-neurophysin VT 1 [Salvelinus alpinus]|uniref:vasotocin-neurophysin VT 1 n=1 Tax=Salvelinus sp. IW2-2015 TaxID=2691554 RepID=UPI000CDF8DF3|nr:vasotocin-neurophysin VT 1 [Salvelinus alpinus]
MPDSTIPLLCVLGLLALSSACYIQNCPRGGKRSFPDLQRPCMSCGPGNRGLCFGPSICCGEGMGCYVGSPEAASCAEENYLHSPCQARGRVCGSEEGHCAAPGVCCDAESCLLDSDCLEDSTRQPPSEQNSSLVEGLAGDLLQWMLHATRRERPQ